MAQKPPPKHCVQSKDSANAMRAAEPRRRSLIAGLLVGSRPSFLTVGRRLTQLIPLPPRRAVQARRLREAYFVEEFRREKDGSERAIREPAPHYVGNETPLVARTNSLFEMQIRNARSQSALRFDGLRIIRDATARSSSDAQFDNSGKRLDPSRLTIARWRRFGCLGLLPTGEADESSAAPILSRERAADSTRDQAAWQPIAGRRRWNVRAGESRSQKSIYRRRDQKP